MTVEFKMEFAYRIFVSAAIIFIYVVTFKQIIDSEKRITKWKLAFYAVISCLGCMLVGCMTSSVVIRLPFDGIVIAAAKGIIPFFVFALFLASPIWITVSVVNFLLMKGLKLKIDQIENL